MVDIRINQLPLDGAPMATDFLPLDNGTTRKATVEAITLAGRPAASQAEAEAGVNAVKAMTPLTTKQAIDALALTPTDIGVTVGNMIEATYDPLAKQANAFDSTNTDFIQSGTGATTRSVRDKLRDVASVKDFGAAGDNSTNDTAAVTSAVANALLSGRILHWPEGTYVTTANIPNLHDVRHVGAGIIKRGANLFAVQSKHTDANSFFAAPAGTSANDGLSSSEPTLPQIAANRLKNYGPVLGGIWSLILADGTYDLSVNSNNTCVPPEGQLSFSRIIIRAATDAGGFRVAPAVTIDRSSASSAFTTAVGGSGKIDVLVKDIKAKGFKLGATPNAEGFRAGFRFGQDATVELYNCWADDCDIGAYLANEVSYTARGCKFTNVATGFQELFHCTRNISNETNEYSEVNAYALSNTYGIRAKELCTGHGNGIRVYDAWCGVHMSRGSTTNMSGATVHRCTYGVMIRNSAAAWTGGVDFGFGTANACGVALIKDASSSFVTEEEELNNNIFTGRGESLMFSFTPDPAYSLTGTTAETVVTNLSKARQGVMAHPGSSMRCRVIGRKGGAAGTLTLFLRWGSSLISALTIPATETIFKVEFDVFTKVKGKQTAFGGALVSTVATTPSRGDRTIDFDSADGQMSFRAQLANAADSVTIDSVFLWSTEALIAEDAI